MERFPHLFLLPLSGKRNEFKTKTVSSGFDIVVAESAFSCEAVLWRLERSFNIDDFRIDQHSLVSALLDHFLQRGPCFLSHEGIWSDLTFSIPKYAISQNVKATYSLSVQKSKQQIK